MYSILRQAKRVPRAPIAFSPELLVPGFWAIDIETKGVDASDPTCEIVGIGLANEKHCFYVDKAALRVREDVRLAVFLNHSTFTAFNVMFDGAFLQQYMGGWLDFKGCSYGLFKQLSGEGFNGQSWSLETAQREVLGWPTSNKTALEAALKERGLTKADMWRLPSEVLGPYSASDADAAWQLWEELAKQAEPFPQALDYHSRVFLPQVRLLAEQQLRGMRIDQPLLKECHAALLANIDRALQNFLWHPATAPHISAWNQKVLDAWKASEPPTTTKGGKESARWQAWLDRKDKLNWFNPNSKQQLGWLFFEKLGNKARKFTETGRQVVDRKVLPMLGEPGKLLNEYNLLVKRRGYVEAVIEKSVRDGLIHPQFNSVGTVTTRLGGSGGLNLQQMPKVVDFLAAFAARPGHVLVQADAEALEPTILAEFSQDKTLLTLYGKDARPNDIYLFVAAKIPALGKEIVRYYDPENPTPEGIKAAKKHCKRDRAIAKTVVLAANYNAGAPKIHETLLLGGIDISLREVREILSGYWRLFGGVKAFEQTLQEMWQANEGWIPSVLGTPICVAPQYLKDINNRFCQTSGHQILQLWIANIDRLRQERGVVMASWLVDMHDETIFECPEGQAEAAVLVIKDALAATNEELGMGIPIKGPPMIADNLAAIKCGEDYQEWLSTRKQTGDKHDDDQQRFLHTNAR